MAQDSVTWEVVGDTGAHPKSKQVIQLLDALKLEHADEGGKQMVVTLESAPGVPVITAKILGLGAFLSVVGGLEKLDLVDRLLMPAGQIEASTPPSHEEGWP
jgi:hypothetical protein